MGCWRNDNHDLRTGRLRLYEPVQTRLKGLRRRLLQPIDRRRLHPRGQQLRPLLQRSPDNVVGPVRLLHSGRNVDLLTG